MNIHPNFRVWVPLLLDFFIATDLRPGVAFDGPQDKVIDCLIRI